MIIRQPVSLSTERRMTFVSVVSALTIFVGGLVLVGWAVDVGALKSILPGWVSVNANTAVAFVLIGIALLFSARPPGLLYNVARLCGWLAGGIGLLTIAEYISGWNPGFDQWLFLELAGTVATSNPGRMAPDSALCFVLLAAGLETVRAVRQRSRMLTISVIFGGIVMSLAAAAVTTYLSPSFGSFGWWGLTNMAVPTATVFVVLGVALIVLARQAGGLNWFLGRGPTWLFTSSLMLMLLLGLHASRSALWQADTALRVRYAEQVLAAISDVLGEAVKTQSHTRGYVITGEDRYLQSEQAASVRCRAAMAELRALLLVPDQQARAVQIEAQINELLQWYPQVIAVRRSGGAGIDQRAMVNHGEDLMERLWASIKQMDNAEGQVLQERSRKAQRVALFTQVFISSITLAGLIIFLSVLVGLNQAELRRQQALEALHASELRYRRLFEAARDGVLILDAETGQVVDVNPYLVELLGVTREVLLGKKVWELGFFKDLVANEANFMELQAKQYIRCDDMALEGHDGMRHEVEFISNVYLVNNQKVIQCNIRDISERVLAAERLRQETEQLQANNEELSRLNRLMTGRELRLIEMKQQVNDLAAQLGQPRPYALAFMDAAAAEDPRTTPQPGEPESEVSLATDAGPSDGAGDEKGFRVRGSGRIFPEP